MMRATNGHPVRALRGAGVLLALWIGYRVPAMRAGFAAAIATSSAPDRVRSVRATVAHDPTTAPTEVATTPPPAAGIGRQTWHAIRSATARPPMREAAFDLPVQVVAVAVSDHLEPKPERSIVPDRAPASDDAAQAYARLAAGNRRAAVRLFDAALAGGSDPRSAAWRAQRNALTRRWSGSAYSILRARGAIDLATTPVLGGGQSGAALAWTPDPLADRPIALTARATAAHDSRGRDALAAVGIAWHPVTGVTLAAERLIAIGPAARSDWTVRLAGGIARAKGAVDTAAYGEAGVVGDAVYAAAQAQVGASLRLGRVALGAGVGAWGSVQRGSGTTVDRLDLGPRVTARSGPVTLSADYRFRVAGNAAPGSGPVVTLTATF